jgi:hypothetical protein
LGDVENWKRVLIMAHAQIKRSAIDLIVLYPT